MRRLTWHNPAILDAAHERMSLFIFVQRDEIMSGLASKVASVRRRAIDRMAANPALFGDLDHPLLALLTPASRDRRPRLLAEDGGKAALEREVADEQAIERDREAAAEREREAAADRERVEVMVERRPSEVATAATASLWPSHIVRPGGVAGSAQSSACPGERRPKSHEARRGRTPSRTLAEGCACH